MLDSHRSDVESFHRARARAGREKLWSRLRGRSTHLLCFKELGDKPEDGLEYQRDYSSVPLKEIVGSFERCADYTPSFLPLKDHDQPRWTRVEQAFMQSKPLPPIQVMKVGQAYFVIDGHHRVSVAKQLGLSHLEAEVLQADSGAQSGS
jgi:hypothetical protein